MKTETDMNGKVVLVTGANSGVGLETAKGLAAMGATVVAACRNEIKGTRAVEAIREFSGNNDVVLLPLDLSDLSSVRSAADRFLKNFDRLDVLVNNAGLITRSRETSADGYELQFSVNHLGHFLLTGLLLPALEAADKARIISVSSGAHHVGKIHFDDIMLERSFSPFKAYGQSKLANILFVRSLAEKLKSKGITANALHPGFVRSGFSADRKTDRHPLLFKLISPFAVSPAKGAETSLFLASSPDVRDTSGEYFAKSRIASTSAASRDMRVGEKLWNLSCQLSGLEY